MDDAPPQRGIIHIKPSVERRQKRLQAPTLLTLVTSLTQHFAVLLFAHPLATLLDDRTHQSLRFLFDTTFSILLLLADTRTAAEHTV